MHASQFLTNPGKFETGPMVAVFGTERYLKRSACDALRTVVLKGSDEQPAVFAGKDATLSDVLDELSMLSMWGDRRLVIVEDADEFVKKYRAALEKYLDKPAKKSVLVLEVKTWNKTTRLAKSLEKCGLPLSCEELKGRELQKWIDQTARVRFGKQVSRDAALLMEELVGNNLGLLEQELDKLSSYVGERAQIEQEDVRALVGGWKTETTWKMLDALRDGQPGRALELLDNLLNAGEPPLKLLGGISFVFRKYSEAAEWSRQGESLGQALRHSKVFPNAIEPSGKFLRKIGRPNAEKILTRLMNADGDLKGRSATPDRIRMEQLLIELSGLIPAESLQ
ncbi:MAG TPA: DNA polymerase III subunit delta [Planctomycetaceae bacterium]|nr:DNA polymerase III subunit delta [Planctomycetaceae bacterium]